MGMKKTTAKRPQIKKQELPKNETVKKIQRENGSAGEVMLHATGNVRTLEYVCVNIPLSDIETNPDNEIFRQADTEEDIERLAEDIDRNGLMHNLVVYEKQEDDKTKFVLLSGERRYHAIKSLAAKGNANWNTVRDCHVVTSKLSDNEKKVLLYSANLQVRGGFGDEQIRRKAGTEFIACLQKEPYNLSTEEATKALKEISSVTPKQTDRDRNIEEKLNKDLLQLLNSHVITRPESETFLKFDGQQQEKIAKHIRALLDATDSDNTAIAEKRNDVLADLIDGVSRAQKELDIDEREKHLEEAFEECDEAIASLKKTAEEYKAAENENDEAKLANLNAEEARRTEKRRVAKKVENSQPIDATFAEKKIQPITSKIESKLKSGSFKKRLKNMDPERRNNDIEILNELIQKATELKQLMESAQ